MSRILSIIAITLATLNFTNTFTDDGDGGIISRMIINSLESKTMHTKNIDTEYIYIPDKALDDFIKNYDGESRVINLDCELLDIQTPTRRVRVINNTNKSKKTAYFKLKNQSDYMNKKTLR